MRYSPAKLPSADVVKTNAMVINDFYGCDFSSGATNIDPRRSPNCENMIRSSPGRVRKAPWLCQNGGIRWPYQWSVLSGWDRYYPCGHETVCRRYADLVRHERCLFGWQELR